MRPGDGVGAQPGPVEVQCVVRIVGVVRGHLAPAVPGIEPGVAAVAVRAGRFFGAAVVQPLLPLRVRGGVGREFGVRPVARFGAAVPGEARGDVRGRSPGPPGDRHPEPFSGDVIGLQAPVDQRAQREGQATKPLRLGPVDERPDLPCDADVPGHLRRTPARGRPRARRAGARGVVEAPARIYGGYVVVPPRRMGCRLRTTTRAKTPVVHRVWMRTGCGPYHEAPPLVRHSGHPGPVPGAVDPVPHRLVVRGRDVPLPGASSHT